MVWSPLANLLFLRVVTDLTKVANVIAFDGFDWSKVGLVVIGIGSTDSSVASWTEISGAELWPVECIRKQSLLTLVG